MAKRKITPIVEDPSKALRAEISKKASMANKRLNRLEKNNLTQQSAYTKWLEGGGERFSVKGKDYNQLQQELARVNRFINNQTSLVRGANAQMKEIAKLTNVSYSKVSELPDKLSTFFELASKVEQYLRTIEDSASAIGYTKIWEVVSEYVEKGVTDIDDILSELGGEESPFYEKYVSKESHDGKYWNLV